MSEPGIEARCGARWWADKLRDGFRLENGALEDDPASAGLAGMVRERMQKQVSAARVDRFEQALAVGIQALVDGGLPPYAMAMSLSVDYHPSPVLHDALLAADLPTGLGVLPFKTTMWVEPGCVMVGDGYGAEPVEVPLAG